MTIDSPSIKRFDFEIATPCGLATTKWLSLRGANATTQSQFSKATVNLDSYGKN
jgi:hypothetical protein